jgi:hypothetical protein
MFALLTQSANRIIFCAMEKARGLFRGNIDSERFRAEDVCRAAPVDASTLRAWRSQHGLMPRTRQLVDQKFRWSSFSFCDCCVARLTVVLVEHGFRAQDAVAFAERFGRLYITNVAGRVRPRDTVIAFGPDEDLPISDKEGALAKALRTTGGVLTAIDLLEIVAHVEQALNLRLVNDSEQESI